MSICNSVFSLNKHPGKGWSRKPEGTWICRYCNKDCGTRRKLLEHYKNHPEYNAHIAEGTKRYLKEHGELYGARYSNKGCEYIEQLNKKNNWHLQHAKNGGEITVGPYYLDGYDKELNIAFEYDEPRHYIDIENNILTERDMNRMQYIKDHLHCKFYRYNEKLDLLYEA